MKKIYPVLYYILAFLCFPIVLVVCDKLDYRKIIDLDLSSYITVLVAVSGIIGLCSPGKWPVDWPLAILLPVSLAVAYFCGGLLDDVFGTQMTYFTFHHALTVVADQPWWLYAAAPLPALLTSFLRKFIKPRWLRFVFIGVLILASVLVILPPAS